MKSFTKKISLILLFASVLTFTLHAQSFTFPAVTSTCNTAINLNTTITITGVKVNSVYNDFVGSTNPSFGFDLIFTLDNSFNINPTASNFYDFTVSLNTTNPKVVGQSISKGITPLNTSNQIITNLNIGNNNEYLGSAASFGFVANTTYTNLTSQQILDIFGFSTSTLTLSSNCFNGTALVGLIGAPLPINLVDFKIKKENNTSVLNWTTAMEQNNKGFEIERSSDSKNWSSIAFVKSTAELGNSTELNSYSFIDANPIQGVNFYRLKQIDFDGVYDLSAITMLDFAKVSLVSIFPNPANKLINISGIEVNDLVKITNIAGQVVHNVKATNELNKIDIGHLSPGLYFVIVNKNNGSVERIKIVKN